MSRFCHCKQSAWTMKQGRVSELSKVIVCKPSRELLYETEFDIWAGFGRLLAGLKLSVISLKYPTFEGVFSIIFWENRKNQKALSKLTDL